MKTTFQFELEANEPLDLSTPIGVLLGLVPGEASKQQDHCSSDPLQAFKEKFGWPAPPHIILKKGGAGFEADKDVIKATKLYRWDKDHGGTGAWVLKD